MLPGVGGWYRSVRYQRDPSAPRQVSSLAHRWLRRGRRGWPGWDHRAGYGAALVSRAAQGLYTLGWSYSYFLLCPWGWRPQVFAMRYHVTGEALRVLTRQSIRHVAHLEQVCRNSLPSGATITPALMCPQAWERDVRMSSTTRGESG